MIHNMQEEVNYFYSPDGMKQIKKSNESLTLKVIDIVLKHAVKNNVSDIHLEPLEESFKVRFRLDGILYDVLNIDDYELRQSLVSSIRAQASMHGEGSAKKKPQDGRWSTTCNGEKVDYRISTFPVIYGEKLVMRIFRQNKSFYVLDTLGLNSDDKELFKRFLTNKTGIVFVTGPTGNGKTTTLYAAINYLNRPEVNIVTLEDPVEFRIERTNQSQIDPSLGFNFSDGLRAILRQDPDIILVGEIRDKETSEIAIRASLTGHLVLTTIHTNDAPTAITRLIDMGIEPFLISATASLIVNQRLLRKVCHTCRVPIAIPHILPKELEVLRTMNIVLYKSEGCHECSGTGYAGRMPVFEFLRTSDEVRKLILNKAPTSDIRNQSIKDGMKTIIDDSLRLLKEEVTTLDEVLKIMIS